MASGFLQYNLVRNYQFIADDRTDGVGTAVNAPGLPELGQPLSMPDGTIVWCTSQVPTRVPGENTERKWNVACTFTNQTQQFDRDVNGNPTDDPLKVVPKFSISFQEVSEQITTARLVNIVKRDGTAVPLPPTLTAATSGLGPITNSAGSVRQRERRAHLKILKYSFYARNWDNAWDDLIDDTNSSEVTFKQRDIDGIRLQQTYDARKLLVINVNKEDIWKQGKLYFKATFSMLSNKATWRHQEPDEGFQRRMFAGQYKRFPAGDTYTQAEIDDQDEPLADFQDITTWTEDGSEVTIAEPVKFNGYGAEIPRRRPNTYDIDETFTLNFDIYDESDLAAAMGLS